MEEDYFTSSTVPTHSPHDKSYERPPNGASLVSSVKIIAGAYTTTTHGVGGPPAQSTRFSGVSG